MNTWIYYTRTDIKPTFTFLYSYQMFFIVILIIKMQNLRNLKSNYLLLLKNGYNLIKLLQEILGVIIFLTILQKNISENLTLNMFQIL